MSRLSSVNKRACYLEVCSVVFILFWLFAAGSKLYDFNAFEIEMRGQVFPATMSHVLVYFLPLLEISIAALLIHPACRLLGMVLSFSIMTLFTAYVGLALLNVYDRVPCNCAGLLGQNASWAANFILNLFITAVAAIGVLLTIKDQERRNKV